MSEARDDDFPSNEKSGFASQLHRHANRLLHPNQFDFLLFLFIYF